MVTLETFCQADEPPVTVGAVGTARSMRTVLARLRAGVQAEARPELSVARNCTSVWPGDAMVTLVPPCGAVQVVPPSVDVRYW